MNAKEFLEIIENIDQLDQEKYRQVLQVNQEFPYFLPPYIISAKHEIGSSKDYSNESLHHAALRSADRKWLKELIEKPLGQLIQVEKDSPIHPSYHQEEPLPSPPEKEDDAVNDTGSSTENSLPLEKNEEKPQIPQTNNSTRDDVLKRLEENLNRFKKKTEDPDMTPPKLESDEEDETGERLIDAIKKKEKKTINDPVQIQQKELIKKFNKKNIRIAPAKTQENQQDLSLNSTMPKSEVVSEPMAKLLVHQKKFEEAKAIYEKLMLKFPEKRAYFADAIEKIEDKS